MWLDLTLDRHEFEGVDGEVHSFPGMSLAGAREFNERLEQLTALRQDFPESANTELLYRQHKRFRWLVDRCLEINHVSPAWVSWEQTHALLFGGFTDAGEPISPLFVAIQKPVESSGSDTGEPQSLEQVIGILCASMSIKEATEAVQNLTPYQLSEIMKGHADALLTPEERHERAQKQELENAREQMLRDMSNGGSQFSPRS
jgi:hypothetical protein